MRAVVLCRLCNSLAVAEEGRDYNPCRCGAIQARSDGRVVIVRSCGGERMPQRPLRPCQHPMCPRLTQDGWCDEHRPKRDHSRYDSKRRSAAKRGYGYKWRLAREAFLRQHPICECDECKRLGRILPAEVVDHIIPHRGDPALFWDTSNWRAMSKRCHDRKTALEDSGFVRRRRSTRQGEGGSRNS